MKPFLLTLLYFVANLQEAQSQFIFVPKKAIKQRVERIDKNEYSFLSDSIPFSAVKIIDSRYDTTNIGFYRDGFLVLPGQSQSIALQDIIAKYDHSLFTPGRDTLLIQLEKLNIEDNISAEKLTSYTLGYVSCREYIGGNNRYSYYRSIDTLIAEEYTYLDALYRHKNKKHTNLEFWDYYLLRLTEALVKPSFTKFDSIFAVNANTITKEDIETEGYLKRHKPILAADNLQPGFYRNFAEFENNNPSFLFVDKEHLQKLLELMHYRTGNKVYKEAPDTSYWGYCDGQKLYVRYGYDFYQLEKHDACYYIAATLDARRQDIGRSGWNFIIGIATLTAGIAAKEGVAFEGFSALTPPDIPRIQLNLDTTNVYGLLIDWDKQQISY